MTKDQVLDTAKSLVCGDRAKQYAPPKKNFLRIANMWTEILGKPVTPAQVAMCMAVVKITRLIENEDHQDSWVDLAGYAACGGEVAEPDKKPDYAEEQKRATISSYSHWGIHG